MKAITENCPRYITAELLVFLIVIMYILLSNNITYDEDCNNKNFPNNSILEVLTFALKYVL